MAERRPTNSEMRLRRVAEEEQSSEERGILELFDEAEEPADEDAALARDDGDE